MIYADLVQRLGQRLSQLTNKFASHSDAAEFTQGMVKLLKKILPSQYGVTLGQAQAEDGALSESAILIFDAEQWPLLKILDNSNPIIPLNSVYAYLEAHPTVYLEGSNNPGDMDTILKRIRQFKHLPRDKTPIINSSQQNLKGLICNNPLYAMIIADNIQLNANKAALTSQQIQPIFNIFCSQLATTGGNALPDIMAVSQDLIALPTNNEKIQSPFLLPAQSQLKPYLTQQKSLALALTTLLQALSLIKLTATPWEQIISSGLSKKSP